MGGPPEIEITAGSPTPEEERAVREAVLALWREERKVTARPEGWSLAARLEATGAGALGVRTWRGGLGFTQPGVVPARKTGRAGQG